MKCFKLMAVLLVLPLWADKTVTLLLDWTPNTNHTGIYVAIDRGYFKRQGIELEVIQAGKLSALQAVASRRMDLAIGGQGSTTKALAKGIPVLSVAAIIQQNTSGFAAVKSKGIKRPRDWEGKAYGGWGGLAEAATIRTIIDQDGGDFDQVEMLTTGSADFFQASKSSVDFAWVFEGWTNIEAKLKGIELDYIPIIKYAKALNYYTPIIVTSQAFAREEQAVLKATMKALRQGYEFAIKNPKTSAAILLKYAPELGKDLVHESAKFLASRYQEDAPYWGYQDQAVWDRYTKWQLDNGIIKKPIDTTKAFSNAFVKP